MSTVVVTADIAKPADEVFNYVTDPLRFGEWQHGTTDIHVHGDPRVAGTTFSTTRRVGPIRRNMTTTSEVAESAPPNRWVARGVDGPVRSLITVGVEPLENGTASRVTIGLDFHGHGIGTLLIPLVRRQARREAPNNGRALRERLGGVSSDRTGIPES